MKVTQFLDSKDSERKVTIAEKTGYSLLSKQQYLRSVFFFLLAKLPHIAMSICISRFADYQLATLISIMSGSEEIKSFPGTNIERFLYKAHYNPDFLPWGVFGSTE